MIDRHRSALVAAQSTNFPDAHLGWELGRLLVFTSDRLMYFPSKTASLRILWCRLLHPRRWKSWSMPSAGKYLNFPITCICGCRYEIQRPNKAGLWATPWKRTR